MNKVVISVGSNIDPERHINDAKHALREEQTLVGESRFVKTAPRGYTNQPEFLNGAFMIETDLDRADLKSYLKSLEKRLGRTRTANKNGPRTIDLDIVMFNNDIVDDDFYNYDFVKAAVEDVIRQTEES